MDVNMFTMSRKETTSQWHLYVCSVYVTESSQQWIKPLRGIKNQSHLNHSHVLESIVIGFEYRSVWVQYD